MTDEVRPSGNMITLSEAGLREIIETPFNRMSESLEKLAAALSGETRRKWRNIYVMVGVVIVGIFFIMGFQVWRAQVNETTKKDQAAEQASVKEAVQEVLNGVIAQNAESPERITKPEVIRLVCDLEERITGQVTLCDPAGNYIGLP